MVGLQANSYYWKSLNSLYADFLKVSVPMWQKNFELPRQTLVRLMCSFVLFFFSILHSRSYARCFWELETDHGQLHNKHLPFLNTALLKMFLLLFFCWFWLASTLFCTAQVDHCQNWREWEKNKSQCRANWRLLHILDVWISLFRLFGLFSGDSDQDQCLVKFPSRYICYLAWREMYEVK